MNIEIINADFLSMFKGKERPMNKPSIGEFFNYTIRTPRGIEADSLRFSQTSAQADHSEEVARREYLARYSLTLEAL